MSKLSAQTSPWLKAVCLGLLVGASALGLRAQEPLPELPPVEAPPVVAPPAPEPAPAQDALPPQEPAAVQEPLPAPAQTAPAKLDLEAALALAMQHQPALHAAQASLNAAVSGERGVSDIRFGRLLSPDLPIRRQQACLGVTIAAAGLRHAEWETRYAVRRTFYSVQYARMQQAVINGAVEKIDASYKRGEQLVKQGDPDIKVTKIDLKVLQVNKEFVKTKRAEAEIGVLKAIAGLREAIGIGPEYPLDVAVAPLPEIVDSLNKAELISTALANRAELEQANAANEVVALEICAQKRLFFRPQAKTFASGSDIHAKPIPTGVANGEYRPGAIGPEMPVFMYGPRRDRVQRASDFADRAGAVVDKTENLIALEVEATYLKWLESSQNVRNLTETPKLAQEVGDDVQKRFNDGKASAEEYLRARTLEDQAKALLNQATYDHALALAGLERVTAGAYRIGARK